MFKNDFEGGLLERDRRDAEHFAKNDTEKYIEELIKQGFLPETALYIEEYKDKVAKALYPIYLEHGINPDKELCYATIKQVDFSGYNTFENTLYALKRKVERAELSREMDSFMKDREVRDTYNSIIETYGADINIFIQFSDSLKGTQTGKIPNDYIGIVSDRQGNITNGTLRLTPYKADPSRSDTFTTFGPSVSFDKFAKGYSIESIKKMENVLMTELPKFINDFYGYMDYLVKAKAQCKELTFEAYKRSLQEQTKEYKQENVDYEDCYRKVSSPEQAKEHKQENADYEDRYRKVSSPEQNNIIKEDSPENYDDCFKKSSDKQMEETVEESPENYDDCFKKSSDKQTEEAVEESPENYDDCFKKSSDKQAEETEELTEEDFDSLFTENKEEESSAQETEELTEEDFDSLFTEGKEEESSVQETKGLAQTDININDIQQVQEDLEIPCIKEMVDKHFTKSNQEKPSALDVLRETLKNISDSAKEKILDTAMTFYNRLKTIGTNAMILGSYCNIRPKILDGIQNIGNALSPLLNDLEKTVKNLSKSHNRDKRKDDDLEK